MTDAERRAKIIRDLSLFAAISLGLVVTILSRDLLPERFGLDSGLIQRIARGQALAYDESYKTPADVYRLLGLADSPTIAALLGYGVAVAALLVVVKRARSDHMSAGTTALTGLCVLLSAIFLGFYSKDMFVFIAVLGVLLPPPTRRGFYVSVLAIVAYAHWFRAYWFVVLAIYLGVLWLFKRGTRLTTIVLAVLAAVAVASAAIFFVNDLPPDFYRVNANELRAGEGNSSSRIEPFVGWGDPLGGVANNVLTAVALTLPVPLAQLGGAYYLLLAATIGGLWVAFFHGLRTLTRGAALEPQVARAAALTLAFAGTQGIFEPDYGSALRHLTPLLPLMLLVVWRAAAVRARSEAVAEGVPADLAAARQ